MALVGNVKRIREESKNISRQGIMHQGFSVLNKSDM
jgi:hypothetical protein